jgi:hypothetical protein
MILGGQVAASIKHYSKDQEVTWFLLMVLKTVYKEGDKFRNSHLKALQWKQKVPSIRNLHLCSCRNKIFEKQPLI